MAELVEASDRRDGPAVPRARRRARERITRRRGRGGAQLPRDAHQGRDRLRHRRARGPAVRRRAVGRAGLPAARHLRLPDRPDARDGRRAGAVGRRAGLPHAHGRAAGQGQGRRQAEEDRRRRHVGLPRAARAGRRPASSPATARCAPRGGCAGCCVDGAAVRVGGARATLVELVLDRTPFYAEGGGQLADAGRIVLSDGTVVQVDDVQKPLGDLSCTAAASSPARRRSGPRSTRRSTSSAAGRSSRAHTATHLVHKAFRDALGESATQAGSVNAPGPLPLRLRLAVGACRRPCWPTSSSRSTRSRWPTSRCARSSPRRTRRGASARWRCSARSTATTCASSRSATTPASSAAARTPQRSGQLGMVKLLSEASIGSGVRRVEGLVGLDAYSYLAREHVLLAQLAVVVQGAGRGGARPGRGAPSRGCARSRRSSPRCAPAQVLQQAGEPSPPAPATSAAWRTSPSRRPTARPATWCARWRSTCAAGSPPTGRRSCWSAAGGERVTLVAAVNDAGRARGLSAERRPARGGRGRRRQGRRQGRRRPGRRHRRRRHRRGAAHAARPRCGRPPGRERPRGRARGRRRHGAGGGGRERPAPGARLAGRDGPGAGAPAGGAARRASARRCWSSSGCRPRCPGGRRSACGRHGADVGRAPAPAGRAGGGAARRRAADDRVGAPRRCGRRARTAKQSRAVVDQAAAVALLQGVLDAGA